jgi:uncharacterized protein (TIGR02757 family)
MPRGKTTGSAVRAPAKTREARRLSRVKRQLDRIRDGCDIGARRDADPVGVVHRFRHPHDQELVGLLAASIAFGNVKTIRAKLEEALQRLGPSPALAADDQLAMFVRMGGWVHRVFRGEDVARLLIGARRIQRSEGSLGALFERLLSSRGDLRATLAAFCQAIRSAGGLPCRGEPNRSARGSPQRRGPAHILPDPLGSGGSKRLLLFLRWMIRPADGVDLGLWRVSPSVLLCPVDTHIHKLAKNLGFTERKDASWRTAEEITRALSQFDPQDPTKYDFSLCHMGMLQRCPSRRDTKKCEGCGVMPVCKHWAGERPS